MAVAAVISITAVNAQGFQRRTVEERVAMVHQKLDSAFKPEASKAAKIDSIFANYYRTVDKARDEMMASGSTDRDAMRAKMMDMANDRDDKLKKVLTEAEMKQWKDAIEPSLRPQRGNRPPGQ